MKKLLIALLAFALMLTACADYTDSVVTNSPQPGETTSDPAGEHTGEEQPSELEMLLESDPLYAVVFSSRFADPEGICLNAADVLRCLTVTAGESVSADTLEEELLGELYASTRSTVHRLTAQAAEELAAARLGLTLADLQGEADAYGFAYWEDDDAYYAAGDWNADRFGTVEVEKLTPMEDGRTEVLYRVDTLPDLSCTAVLEQVDDRWIVTSNLLTDLSGREDTLTTDGELAVFEQLFGWGDFWYANALTGFYASPETVDLFQFFYDHRGYTVDKSELSDAEKDYYVGLLGEIFLELDNTCISAADADAVLMQYFGFTLADTAEGTIPGFTYDPKHDAYIYIHSDTNAVTVDPQYAVFTGEDTMELYYVNRISSVQDYLCVVTLREVDGAWQVVSNLPANPTDSLYTHQAEIWEAISDPEGWHLTFLASEFERPEEVDPWPIFSNQPSDWLSDIEMRFLTDLWGEDGIMVDVTRVPADELDAVLQECVGITLDELDAKDGTRLFPYFADTGCYYISRGGVIISSADVELLYCEDDWTELMFHYLRYGHDEYVVTVSRTDDGWHIVSNLPVGE